MLFLLNPYVVAPVSLVLAAEAGSYALSGQPATLRLERRLAAAAGAFALDGQDANLLLDTSKVLAADAGAFALSGSDASLRRGRVLAAAAGAFALSGQDAALRLGVRLAALAGSFSLTGQDAALRRAAALSAAAGSFTLTGQAATLRRDRRMSADAGAFALSGQDAVLRKGKVLAVEAGSYALTGQDATLTYAPGGISALSFVGSASGGATGSGSVSVTIPAGAQAGDLCIWMQSLFGANVTNTLPADFSSLDAKGISSTGFATQWAYKILDGADAGASKTGGSANTGGTMQRSAVALVFRPDRAISSVALGAAISDNDTAANPAPQLLSLNGNTSVLVALGHLMGTGTVNPRTASPAMNEVQGGVDRHWVLYSLTAADYTIDMDDEGVNRLQSGYIVVT